MLAVTCVATIGIVSYVHYDQKRQIARMRQSVFADAVREQNRRDAVLSQSNNGAVEKSSDLSTT